MMNYARIFLNPKEDREISQGFPWVYDNEISSVKYEDSKAGIKTVSLEESNIPDGSVVEVYTKAGGFLGTGIFNRKSRIIIRLLSHNLHADEIMSDVQKYWDKIIGNSVNVRRLDFTDDESIRLVFGEADFAPGLIVDRYVEGEGDDRKTYLVVQFLAMAVEVFKKEILNALEKWCNPEGIYERSDDLVREKEGLPLITVWHGKQGKNIIRIKENGIFLDVDIVGGQKTGYFLDQKRNRYELRKYVHSKRVLDTFTHTGAFGLNAVKGGAKEVISVDISQEAVDMVNNNININHAENVMKAVCADVFDLLKDYENSGEKFDVIVLDPPAFTKSAKMIQKAYGGYKEINLRAMRLLNEGGILVTCSCSHYFDSYTFYDMIMHAARDSHKSVQVLQKRGASSDHPLLMGYPKSEYLKCAICRVL